MDVVYDIPSCTCQTFEEQSGCVYPCVAKALGAINTTATVSTGSIGSRSNAWRQRRNLSVDPAWIMAKATEEIGEVARALVGDYENRPGRGDVVQEAAQTIIVLASLVDAVCGLDVMTEVEHELRKLGA